MSVSASYGFRDIYRYMAGEEIYSIMISNNIMENCHAERYFVGLLLNEILNMYIH